MYRLPEMTEPFDFPDDFETTPEGLLAMGGNLHPVTLIHAYAKGIFPWFSEGDPLLWWHPSPRQVLFPDDLYLSKNMRKLLKKTSFRWSGRDFPDDETRYLVTMNESFVDVIESCANRKGDKTGTWILPEMKMAYVQLFEMGYAHSFEVWNSDGNLVGGLYGVGLAKGFFGESMFSLESDTSKVALAYLCRLAKHHGIRFVDCQVESQHLNSMGAKLLSQVEFIKELELAGTDSKIPIAFDQGEYPKSFFRQ